jgi:glycosyltransferase involved in cell wall biosynthesis
MISICIISTYLNHHNKPLCDELFGMTHGGFYYVSTSNIGEMRKNMGFSQMKADYLLDYVNSSNPEDIQKVIDDVDVVLISSSAPVKLVKNRMASNALTFRFSERLFKTRTRYLKAPIHWMRSFLTRKAYLLCNSAATARDYNLLGFYKNRCYKWGYFTEVKKINPDILWAEKKNNRLKNQVVSILWVGRLIGWKHPETAIFALHKAQKRGYQFDFKIIGDGPKAPELRALIDRLGMNECIHLLGTKSAEEVRRYMEECEIFLFTSDRQEGWGAVLNESMSCACAVVANSEIGAVPFLIKDKINGMIYQKGSYESLVDCLITLFESEAYMKRLGVEAYKTISENWAPQCAAENLLALINSILNNKENPIKEGPCSVSK